MRLKLLIAFVSFVVARRRQVEHRGRVLRKLVMDKMKADVRRRTAPVA